MSDVSEFPERNAMPDEEYAHADLNIFGIKIGTYYNFNEKESSVVEFNNFDPTPEFVQHIPPCVKLRIGFQFGDIVAITDDEYGGSIVINAAMFLQLLSVASAGKEAGKR